MRQRPLDSIGSSSTPDSPWWLFGVRGIVLSDETSWIESPLLGDATLMPREPVVAALADESTATDYPLRRRVAGMLHLAPGSEDDVVKSVAPLVEPADSFVAVRRAGRPTDRDAHTDAFARAREVLAVLSLIIFGSNPDATSIGFSGQFRDGKLGARVALSGDGRNVIGFAVQPYVYYPMAMPEGKILRVTRKGVEGQLQHLFHRDLWALATRRAPDVNRSFQAIILRAATRAFDAIHAPTFDARLLGAVTAVEILVGDQSGGWNSLKQRVRALLGKGHEAFRADEVWSARHAYVHDGAEISPVAALLSCGLAASVLFHVAALAGRCKTRDALISYLDLLVAVDRTSALWAGGAESPLKTIQLHLRGPHIFPWLERADAIAVETALHPDS